METVIRKDGPRYRESYYLDHKKCHGPFFRRKADAKAWKNRVESDKSYRLALGLSLEESKSDVKFCDYAQKWLDTHVAVNCSAKALLYYQSILAIHLLPRFEKMNLREIKEEHGIALMQSLKSRHNSGGIRNIWGTMKTILSRARKEKLISADPFENVRRPRLDLRQDTYWEKADITLFLETASEDVLFPLYFTAIHTGMRLAELCGLKWDRIDFQNNLITITRTRDKTGLKETTKTKSKRIIPIHPGLRSILIEMQQKNSSLSDFVFLERSGGEVRYGHIYRRFKKAQAKAGVSCFIRFHDLRHTFASNYMANGGNVYELQMILGHTKTEMTQRYAHLSPGHLQNSLKYMNMKLGEV